MGNWSNLVKEIQGTVGYFQELIGVKTDKKKSLYPQTQNTTVVKDANWNQALPYSFKVINKKNSNDYDNFGEFKLQINPSELEQDENFAITMTPTQGGIVVEHNSIVFRDLIIAGTTGVHPLRGTGGVQRNGKAIGASTDIESGYKHFQNLRNYFIAYADKKKEASNKDAQLVFINRKENLTLIIEPLKFSLKRAVPKNTLFNYSITFKVLGLLEPPKEDTKGPWDKDKLDEFLEKTSDVLDIARGAMLKSQDLLAKVESNVTQTILEPMRKASLFVKDAANLGFSILDLPGKLANDLARGTYFAFTDAVASFKAEGHPAFTSIVLPTNIQKEIDNGNGPTIMSSTSPQALSAVPTSILNDSEQAVFQDDITKNSALPRQFFEDLKAEATRVKDNAADAFALGDTGYDNFQGRTSTFTPSSIKQATAEEVDILNAFQQLDQVLSNILSSDNLFQSDMTSKVTWEEEQFGNTIDLLVPGSVYEIVLPQDVTLEDLASKYLGSAERWPDIVIVNNLKPPYISSTSTDVRVKKPGDKILIPSGIPSDRTQLPSTKAYPINESLTQTEKNLGIDLRLSSEFDLVFTNQHDFDLVAGGANAGQAIIIKTQLEKGDLKYHTSIGMNLQIGEKMTSAEAIYDELTRNLLQDPRFESITSLKVRIEGNVIYAQMNLKVKELNEPVPLTLII